MTATGPVLALDCSGAACAVAVALDDGTGAGVMLLAHRQQSMDRGHALALVPMIEATLAAANLRPADLGLIAATVGPGSFTGVRIGLATARGLALALEIPLAGLTTIETLLAGATAADRRRLDTEGRLLVAAIDTHRRDYYVGCPGVPTPYVGDATAIAARNTGALLVIGDGAPSLCQALAALDRDAQPAAGPATPDPAVLAGLALRPGIAGWRARNRSEGMPRPLYLRPAEVTRPRRDLG